MAQETKLTFSVTAETEDEWRAIAKTIGLQPTRIAACRVSPNPAEFNVAWTYDIWSGPTSARGEMEEALRGFLDTHSEAIRQIARDWCAEVLCLLTDEDKPSSGGFLLCPSTLSGLGQCGVSLSVLLIGKG